jgi:hypothetical protein
MSDISFCLVFDTSRHTAETGQDPKGNPNKKSVKMAVFGGSPLRGVTVSRQDDERGGQPKKGIFTKMPLMLK